MKHEFNVEICGATNVPCSHCQPVCDHLLICDKCSNTQCFGNFNGWCRQMSFRCFLRANVPEMGQVFEERIRGRQNESKSN